MFKENKKMKATKKIVGAACALVAAVALSAGSTFAWFVSNQDVTATGLQVNVNTSNSYLVIGSSYSELRAADREDPTTISLAPTESNPLKTLNPSAHLAIDESPSEGVADSGKILVKDLVDASSWYTGQGTTPDNGALNESTKTPLSAFTVENSVYVVEADIFVSVATGSQSVSNVMMKVEAEGGWKSTNTAGTNNSAISVIMLYQNITNGQSAEDWTTYVEANAANNHAISAASHGYLDLGKVTEGDYLQIHVMVYFDGNNADVEGINAANLTGVTLNFTFEDGSLPKFKPAQEQGS